MHDAAFSELDSASEIEAAPLSTVDWEEVRELSVRPGGFGERRVELWARLLNVDPSLKLSPNGVHSSKNGDAQANADSEKSGYLEQTVEPHPDERQVRLDTDRSFVLYPVGDGRETRQNGLHELIVSVFRKRRRLSYFQGYHDIVSVLFLTLPKELQFACVEKLSLHRVRDSMGASLEPVVGLLRVLKRVLALVDQDYAARLARHTALPYYSLSNLLTLFSHDVPTLPLIQHVFDYVLSRPPEIIVYLAAAIILTRKHEVDILEREGEEGMVHSLLSSLPDLYEEMEEDGTVLEEPQDTADINTPNPDSCEAEKAAVDTPPTSTQEDPIDTFAEPAEPSASETPLDGDARAEEVGDVSASATLRRRIVSADSVPEKSVHVLETSDDTVQTYSTALEDQEAAAAPEPKNVPATRSRSMSFPARAHRPRLSLTSLLRQTDELFSQYPPSHPAILLSGIMGPQSVVFTWSESPSELPADDEAELMVTQPQLVVLPMQPEEMDDKEESEEEEEEERRRKRKRPRKPTRIVVQRKAVVASAVLVLGVAMAIYGLQTAPERGRGRYEVRRLSRLFGGFVVAAGERLWEGLVAMTV